MDKRISWSLIAVGCLALTLGAIPATAQTCAPLDNGHMADAFYEGTVIFWDPVVEFQRMTLTISGPCEDIVKTFTPKDQLMFDIREIKRIVDGEYTWTLKREGSIDPDLQNELQQARFSGEEDDLWWSAFQAGKIPAGPYTDSGTFTVERGAIIDPGSGQEKSAAVRGKAAASGSASALQTSVAGGFASEAAGDNPLATKDTVLTNANGVIRNSLCVGFDCANSNTYSDTTILLRENNTRIKFDDTSTINSFPRNDWEIEANSNLNGGASYLGFNDCGQSSGGGCATDLVFAVEAGARQNALYVESDGDVGVGTSNPVVRMHLIDGDTPALRLEQDGSSGFAPQTWDVAGNETSFFVRDATNGSTLPFRIRPGAASNSLVIDADDDVGIGVLSASAKLHLRGVDGGSGNSLKLNFENTGTSTTWFFQNDQDETFKISKTGSGGAEITVDQRLDANGATLRVDGSVQATNVTFSSSRTLKDGIRAVNPQDVLARLAQLPIAEWTFKADPHQTRHIGPMAEDFHAAFPVGSSDKAISVTDASGITMAAVQGLLLRLEELERQNIELSQRLEAVEEASSTKN